MAPTDAQIAANIERRRSERWPLAMPVIVSGVSLDSKPFHEDTITLSVSTHGALVALVTTVTLGQTLYIRNPQTQNEVGAWVTRFGHPRGGLSQVGVEFVQPDEKFWSNKADVKLSYDAVRSGAQEADLVLPETSPDASSGAQISPSGIPGGAGTQGILLHALEQTLRQAAEQAVATAAGTSLGSAVNHALAAIDDFSRDRLRLMEERLAVYRCEAIALAREELFSQVQADLARAEGSSANVPPSLLRMPRARRSAILPRAYLTTPTWSRCNLRKTRLARQPTTLPGFPTRCSRLQVRRRPRSKAKPPSSTRYAKRPRTNSDIPSAKPRKKSNRSQLCWMEPMLAGRLACVHFRTN